MAVVVVDAVVADVVVAVALGDVAVEVDLTVTVVVVVVGVVVVAGGDVAVAVDLAVADDLVSVVAVYFESKYLYQNYPNGVLTNTLLHQYRLHQHLHDQRRYLRCYRSHDPCDPYDPCIG